MYEESVGMDANMTGLQPEVQETPLMQIGRWYSSIHGYASLIVCLFGICTNIFNITVLARKDMQTPTNILLTWLAVSDILTMIPYVPFVCHFYCAFSPDDMSPEKFSYGWVVYMLFVINVGATTHTISIWLGVALAVFRFVQIRSTSKGTLVRQRMKSNIQKVTAVVYVLSTLVLIPNYITNELEEMTLPGNVTI